MHKSPNLQFFEDREKVFWLLHTCGWVGYAAVHYLGSLIHEMRDIYWIVIVLSAFAGWIITIPLRYIYQKVWNAAPWKIIVSILFSSFVVGMIWTIVKNFNYWEIYKYGYRPDSWIHYFSYNTLAIYIMLCWSGLYFGIKFYQMLQQEKQKALRANTMAHQAQLKMLRYQLNPHFLFNTLNAISTLVLIEENKTANGMVTRLSDFLRYSLDNDPIKKVQVEQEIKALKLYLDIEKVRFEDRLNVEWEIDESCLEAQVPSLILQPLIENAIKYAISKQVDGGTIAISIKHFASDLLIELADDGPGAQVVSGKLAREGGVGIPNTRERLQSLYDSNYAFTIENNQPRGLKISIRIPYES